MIETIVALKWALIFSSVYAPPGRPEQIEHRRYERDFATFDACEKHGSETLAVIDVAEYVSPRFACIPVGAAAPRRTGRVPKNAG